MAELLAAAGLSGLAVDEMDTSSQLEDDEDDSDGDGDEWDDGYEEEDDYEEDDSREEIAAEWAAIEAKQAARLEAEEGGGGGGGRRMGIREKSDGVWERIKVWELVRRYEEEYERGDLGEAEARVKPEGSRSMWSKVFGPGGLDRESVVGREAHVIEVVGKVSLRDDVGHDVRALNSVYMGLTGGGVAPRRFGAHWGVVGFQGKDPGTDLRGVGMLGLVALLYFVEEGGEVVEGAWECARGGGGWGGEFPFVLVGVRFVGVVVRRLRGRRLNKRILKEAGGGGGGGGGRGAAWRVFFEEYVGVWREFMGEWRRRRGKVEDFDGIVRGLGL